MAKKINDKLKKIPNNEKVILTFNGDNDVCFVITSDKTNNTYYLYKKLDTGYQYLKSRKKDPCFSECY